MTRTRVVVLVILAVIFGVGAVLEGVAWVLLIAAALTAAAIWFGWGRVRGLADGKR